jgi:hypothetical protein
MWISCFWSADASLNASIPLPSVTHGVTVEAKHSSALHFYSERNWAVSNQRFAATLVTNIYTFSPKFSDNRCKFGARVGKRATHPASDGPLDQQSAFCRRSW